eukprot:83194-Prorocentrum_minimum.AAC.1
MGPGKKDVSDAALIYCNLNLCHAAGGGLRLGVARASGGAGRGVQAVHRAPRRAAGGDQHVAGAHVGPGQEHLRKGLQVLQRARPETLKN